MKRKIVLALVMTAGMSLPLFAQTPEDVLDDLGIELTVPDAPVASFVHAVTAGNLVFLSGHGPAIPGGGYIAGKVGGDLTLEEGQLAARYTAISLLSSLKQEIGDLSRVKRIVRVFGMVNTADGFNDTPAVINGCSDLLIEVFGDKGRHARAAVGMAELPFDIAVEIEMIVELIDPE